MRYELDTLLSDIGEEVTRSRNLHGPIVNHLHASYAIILEELDEFWDEVKINPKKLEGWQIEERKKNIKKELIQVAAMCVKTLMDVEL